MKTIVVVGGAGFIGSWLCEKLAFAGNQVFCVDSLITGDVVNIEQLYNARHFRFMREDVSYHAIMDKLIADGIDWRHVQEIYYLASIASPGHYLKMPIETFNANVKGLQNFLEIATRNRIKILYTSTSEVYGDPLEHPQSETYHGNVDPCSDRAVYDESKRFGETLVSAYRRRYGIDTRIVRIFNTYGPRMARNDGRVIPNFIMQSLSNKDLTIQGDGSQTRSFCYVEDTVNGLIATMNHNWVNPINIGNPQEYFSILELAQLIKKITGSSSKIVQIPFISENDPKVRRPDISLAQAKINWQPRIGLQNGLTTTIQHFKDAYLAKT